jgi:hypothetical protein
MPAILPHAPTAAELDHRPARRRSALLCFQLSVSLCGRRRHVRLRCHLGLSPASMACEQCCSPFVQVMVGLRGLTLRGARLSHLKVLLDDGQVFLRE